MLEQILAHPHDTELRRVYADQLTERGDPQGPFIAHQCALAEMDALHPERGRLLAATRRLQNAHETDWLAPLLADLPPAFTSRSPVSNMRNALFERGFLHRLALTLDDLPLVETLRARSPLAGVELLVGEHIPDDTPAPASARDWTTLKVTPDGWFTASSVARALCWGTQSLTELDLGGCSLGTDGASLLVGEETDLGEHFDDFVAPEPLVEGQLRTLLLKNTQLGDDGLQILLGSERLRGLQALGLDQCRLVDADRLAALPTSPLAATLTHLSLAGNNTLDITALAGWERLPELVRLGLPKATTPETFSALFPEPSTALRQLDLAGAKPLMVDAARVFAASDAFTHLNLSTARIGDAGFAALLEAPSSTPLSMLRVNGCSLSDKSVLALVDSGIERLVELDISSNKLTDAALVALAAWPGLANVTHLRMGNNRKVGRAGHEALAASSHFDPVVFDVGKVADEGVQQLLRKRYDRTLRMG